MGMKLKYSILILVGLFTFIFQASATRQNLDKDKRAINKRYGGVLSSFDSLLKSYINARMGYHSGGGGFGGGGGSSLTSALGLIIGVPLLLTILPLITGPLVSLLGLLGIGNINTVVPTGIPTVTIGKRSIREVPEIALRSEASTMVKNVANCIYNYGALEKECKKRVICEIHHKDMPKKSGNLAASLSKFLRHSNVSSLISRYISIEEYLRAAELGSKKGKCNLFYKNCQKSTEEFMNNFRQAVLIS